MCSGGRLCSGPRVAGTTQYVQNLSHPICTRTNAWNAVGRIDGSRAGTLVVAASREAEIATVSALLSEDIFT